MTNYGLLLDEIREEHGKSKNVAERIIEARTEAKRAEVKRLKQLVGEGNHCKKCFSGDWSE